MIIVETNKEKDQFLEYWNNEESTIIPIWGRFGKTSL